MHDLEALLARVAVSWYTADQHDARQEILARVAALEAVREALEELVAMLETNTEYGAPAYAHKALAAVAAANPEEQKEDACTRTNADASSASRVVGRDPEDDSGFALPPGWAANPEANE